MHVSNLVTSPPPAQRSDPRASAPSDADFASVYGAERRRPAGAETSRSDARTSEPAPLRKDTGDASRKSDDRAAPREDAQAEDRDRTDADAAAVSGPHGSAQSPEPAPVVPEAVVDPETGRPATADQAVPAAGESPAPRRPPADGAEARLPGEAAQAGGRLTTQPEPAAARPAAATADEMPAPVREATASPATASAPAPARSPEAEPQTAPPATSAPATAAVAEEVAVRRARPEASAAIAAGTGSSAAAAARVAPQPSKPAVAFAAPAVEPVPEVRPDIIDTAMADVAPSEGRSTADHAARVEATVRHDTPRPVMQQIAEAARALRDGPVELTMQPEELGKVRMTLSAGADGAMTLMVQAERPETLDLVRRHIGELARELQEMGFENLSFSFGQDRASAEPQRPAPADDDSAPTVAAIPLAQHGFPARAAQVATAGGLDLRL